MNFKKKHFLLSLFILTNLNFYFSCTNESTLSPFLTKKNEISNAPITEYDWTIINQAKLDGLKAITKAIHLEDSKFNRLIAKHFNLRPNPRRCLDFRKQLHKIHDTLSSLSKNNFMKSPTSWVAYVYCDDKRKIIRLGHTFFQLENVGFDSKASVLLHEVTHWKECRGTYDYAYSDKKMELLSCCLRLNNANSWETFIIEASLSN